MSKSEFTDNRPGATGDDEIKDAPKVGKGKRNPTRWLVGLWDTVKDIGHGYEEIVAVGAKAAIESYAVEHGTDGAVVVVWPLRAGKGPLRFSMATVTVTQTTITEAK